MLWIISCILSIYSSSFSLNMDFLLTLSEEQEIGYIFKNGENKDNLKSFPPFSSLANEEENYRSSGNSTILPLKDFHLKNYLQKSENLQINFIYTLLFLFLFAIIRFRANDLLVSWAILPFKRKKFEFILNEGITQNIFYYMGALFLSLSIFAILIQYTFFKNFDYSDIGYKFCFLLSIHFYQLIIVSLAGWIFNMKNCSAEGISNIWAFSIIMGLLLFPFILSLFFINPAGVPLLLKTIWIALLILYLIKILRLLQILFSYKVSIFYMILYLCVLEVIPLFMLYKILV